MQPLQAHLSRAAPGTCGWSPFGCNYSCHSRKFSLELNPIFDPMIIRKKYVKFSSLRYPIFSSDIENPDCHFASHRGDCQPGDKGRTAGGTRARIRNWARRPQPGSGCDPEQAQSSALPCVARDDSSGCLLTASTCQCVTSPVFWAAAGEVGTTATLGTASTVLASSTGQAGAAHGSQVRLVLSSRWRVPYRAIG